MDPLKMVGIAVVGLVVFSMALILVAAAMTTNEPAPEPTPMPTIVPTSTPTPTPAPTPEPVAESPNQTEPNNDTTYKALQDLANTDLLFGQTPNNYTTNLTGNEYVDYTSLADMYPWIKYGYNNSSPFLWMHDEPTFKNETNGEGYSQRIDLFNAWKAVQLAKLPALKLDILHTDGTPVDFYRETFILGNWYTLVFRITDIGQGWYQGPVNVAGKATFNFQGTTLTLEQAIMTHEVSVTPNTCNDFTWVGQLGDFQGRPVYPTAYSVTIELRDPSDGHTMYSLHIPVTVGYPTDDGNVATNG